MKAEIQFVLRTFGAAVCLVAVMLTAGASAQNIFVSESATGNIYEFTPSGVRTTFASGLNDPGALAFDSMGDLFAAVSGGIVDFTSGGTQINFASGLNEPASIAINSAGDLFESDSDSGSIYEFTPQGVGSTFWQGEPVTSGYGPLAFDSAGDLFAGTGSIYEFINNNGTLSSTPVYSSAGVSHTRVITLDNSGNVFAGGFLGHTITEIMPNGDESLYASTDINEPAGLEFDGSGDLFVANHGALSGFGGTVAEILPGGTPTIFASELDEPSGLAIDPVPEPSVLALLSASTISLLAYRRRRSAPISS
jgi:hypothetical protein